MEKRSVRIILPLAVCHLHLLSVKLLAGFELGSLRLRLTYRFNRPNVPKDKKTGFFLVLYTLVGSVEIGQCLAGVVVTRI